VLLLVVAAAGLASTTAPAATEPVLKISFPEGWSAGQMADRAAEVRQIAIRKRGVTPLLSGSSYAAATRVAKVPAPFKPFLKRRSVEGFLFPSLYEFTKDTTAQELVDAQIATFRERWRTIDLTRARTKNLTPYDVLILASMIERETVAPEERRLVSAVIYNRLKARMPLAIDATLRYGLGIPGTRPLTKKHLRSRSPYNTRLHRGLPPTPIGNPGVPSMRAAARPAGRNYLYYLRRPGSIRHFFTASEAEFCEKAREWGYTETC